MSSPQPFSSDTLRRHRLSVDDYYKMGEAGIFKEKDRVELIEGEIIDMVPIGSRPAYTLNKLNKVFTKQLADDYLVRVQDPIRLDQYNEPEPDLTIVTNKNYSTHHPSPEDALLVIEIADSSLSYDISIKIPLYARYDIPEAWVINLNENKIHIFNRLQNGAYQNREDILSGTLSPLEISNFVFQVGELWREM